MNILLISGSRTIENPPAEFIARLSEILLFEEIDKIVCGDAQGIDLWTIENIKYCDVEVWYPQMNGLKYDKRQLLKLPPVSVEGGTHKSCYIIRDYAMVDYCTLHKSRFLACWDGESNGTIATVKYAVKQGLAGELFNIKTNKKHIWENK